MKEFDYDLDYKKLNFTDTETRELYRIGRGEQGVLLVRPYTNIICNHWRFKTPREAIISSNKIFAMYLDYRDEGDFIGMDMCRKFLEMDLLVPEDMLIITLVENTKKELKKSYLKKKIIYQVNMLNLQRYLKRFVTLLQKVMFMLK